MMSTIAAVCLLFACCALLPDRANAEENAIELDSNSFDGFIQENPLVLVMFYAPWCAHCKQFAPEFEAAAKALKSDNVPLARVDGAHELNQALAEKHEIQGFPTIKLFRAGKVSDYGGERSTDAIVAYMRKRSGPAVKELLSQADLEMFKQEHAAVFVGFLSDKESAAYQAFEKAAKQVDEVGFANIQDAGVRDGVGAARESLVLWKSFDEGRVDYDGEMTAEDISEFAKLQSLPKVISFTEKTAAQIFGSGIKVHLVSFYDQGVHKALDAQILEPATEYRGKLLFIHISPEEQQIMDYFGVSKENLPAVRIVDLSTDVMRKYAFEGSEITGPSVSAFIKKFRMGKIQQVLRSEDVPGSQDEDVRQIVQKTFQAEVLETDKDVLVEFYAPWCGHCKELKPKYDELAKSLKDVSTLTIAKVNAEANELPDVKIEGFPTIKLWPGGHKDAPINYQGERTQEGLLEFLKEHVTHKWFGDKRDEL